MPLYKSTLSIGTGWDDLPISGVNLPSTGANAPVISQYRGNIHLLAFATNLLKETWTTIHLGHDIRPSAKIYPHIHWTHNNATPSGSVVWKIDYTMANAFADQGFPIEQTITLQSSAGIQYGHQVVEVADEDAINTVLKPDTVVLLRIYRDVTDENDTFDDDAFLVIFDAHYESDGRRTSDKRPPFTKIL
jgi:hypothetical protein